MTSHQLAFVSFEPVEAQFRGYLSMEAAIRSEREPEDLLREAAKIYARAIKRMNSIIVKVKSARANRKPISARKIWELGHVIFALRDDLENLGLQLDGVYDHLSRDLGAKRKWLEKVVILRRHVPEKTLIPKSLNWGRCEKGTRRVAEGLRKGLLPT